MRYMIVIEKKVYYSECKGRLIYLSRRERQAKKMIHIEHDLTGGSSVHSRTRFHSQHCSVRSLSSAQPFAAADQLGKSFSSWQLSPRQPFRNHHLLLISSRPFFTKVSIGRQRSSAPPPPAISLLGFQLVPNKVCFSTSPRFFEHGSILDG